ncbi:MAG: hypothetical protein GSR73_04245 [Desulfurococcales archaeon]|nr:hypothetical protein [Desulfurococcales archaeon]
MSYSEKEQLASREEVVSWIKHRIEELENELKMLKSILYHYEEGAPGRLSIDEKVEEVKVGRRRIARLYIGDNYVRIVPEFEMVLIGDMKEYLDEIIDEIREKQVKEGVEEQDQAKLTIRERTNGSIKEIIISNIEGIAEVIKAKAALKYVAELAWEIYKAKEKSE